MPPRRAAARVLVVDDDRITRHMAQSVLEKAGFAVQAATIRSSMRLLLPDAMVIAAGLLAGCEAIVSNDARWKQRGAGLFPQFRWIYLSDYL